MRVLIVDDMPEIRRMVRSRLEKDHEVVGELSDGYAVASEVEETRPDVVIMDLKMPIIDGAEATRQIKALFPHVLVLGFTSAGESGQTLLEAGADAWFSKADLEALCGYLGGDGNDLPR